MVDVTVLYFAAIRELVGQAEERLTLPPHVTDVGAFTHYLEQHRPALAGRLASVRVARNEVFASNDDALSDGDVLALVPPVAGG